MLLNGRNFGPQSQSFLSKTCHKILTEVIRRREKQWQCHPNAGQSGLFKMSIILFPWIFKGLVPYIG